MTTLRQLVHLQRRADLLDLVADVLVIGGGPAASWAALAASAEGARVAVVDKGYLGTSGATAPTNTGTWFVPPGDGRAAAIERRQQLNGGLAIARWVDRTLHLAWQRLHTLADWGYKFPHDDAGKPYLNNLRGPDYMAFMRRRVLRAGVAILDHHPALELVSESGVVCGATGIDRQRNRPWRVRAGAVVLASGGCAFGERMLGATGLTGDGYLMAAEAGAALSGMEFSAQYACAPRHTCMNKGMPFVWASFYREDGARLDTDNKDRYAVVAQALLEGPVWGRLDRGTPELSQWLRVGQPNCFLPYDRAGVDPFTQKFPVTLRCEGTVRGVGGIKLVSDDCATGVPGLYAAGDAASRERLTGAISGGGGPNSSWAIASGNWAGAAAARFAAREGANRAERKPVAMGGAGLRPAKAARAALRAADIVQTVRDEFLPLDHNFFRNEATLRQSLDRLERTWRDLRDHLAGAGTAAVKAREAAALTATSRWAFASALARAESRGMQRRIDLPAADPQFVCALEATGLDHIEVKRSALADTVDAVTA
ncbi:MAG: FAD-binding protein [Betaproteobacteria bacterium]|nr:FAD-binding protein [Betaproteobacteria bacterium]